MKLFHAPILILAVGLTVTACSEPPEPSRQGETAAVSGVALVQKGPDEAAIAANNRGVGLMGRFAYIEAEQIFAQLAQNHPEWLDVQVNLAIAALNRQQEGDETRALAIVEGVIRADPSHLRAQYVAGLLRLYLSSAAEALVHFRAVADGDPKDAYAAYYLAQCLAQQSEYEQALEWYRRSLALDPYLRSAYYGTFQAMQRLKLRKEARQVIMDYQRLAKNPRARLVEFKYTRMGSKGEALAINMATPAVVKRPQGPLFSPPRPLIEAVGKGISGTRWAPSRPAGVTPVDMQGDGVLELFITNVAGGEGDSSLLMSRGADGNFSPLPSHPLAGVSKVNATLWGDFDNDGLTDVYLCRRGRNQLWRQVVKGEWEDVTAATGTANGELDTVDGAFFDADHDGDLDLFLINADGPNELLNNNLNGSFRPIAVEQGIAGKQTASRGVVLMDLDRDRDTDLVIINREPPHEVFLNDRLWSYHPATGFGGFNALPALAAVAGDLDADGIPELYSMMETGRLLRWRLDNNGDYQSQSLGEFTLGTEEGANGFAQLAILDANGDGRLELLVATGAGWWIFDPEQRRRLFQAEAVGTDRLIGVAPFLDDPTTGPAVVGVMAGGGMKVWRSGTGRHSYLSFALSGREESGQSMRSNASGIGARVAVRTGSRWSMPPAFGGFSGPGRGLQPISVGLGGASRADFVSIDWSDGVYQSELDLEAGGVHRITETQRQLSSCPVLFAWDGEQYRFISDLLGVGGLGYAVAPGEYAPPRPWENLLLPEGLLHSRDGRYLLKFTEPMEEAAYLDGARLVAWDLPPGWKMVLDERMGITGPEPTGKARFYRGEMTPSRVENDRGEVVTAQVNLTDGRAATVGPLDHRFIGRLRREHVLVLEFPEPLDAYSGAPMLVADGWVEYPYSQTMFAAWQAEAEFAAPTLEARGEDGAWHTVMEQFGYPAGMPRRMSVPLKNLPPGTRMLRLRTNMEIYWDRLAVAFAEPLPEARRTALPLLDARLAKTGFPRWSTAAQRRPHYDYNRRGPFWDTRYMAGFYTRLGPVRELVDRVDDAVAIIGPGEEVHLEFSAAGDGPPAGWSRRFVLESNGWAKDMDLYTKNAETIAPLPTNGKPPGPRDELHARYNTRYQAGR